MDIEQINQQIKSSAAAATKKICFKIRKLKESKLTTATVLLMDQRRGLEKRTKERRTLYKRGEKAMRRDLGAHKTRKIQETIEKNAYMRVLRSKLSNGKTKLTKLKNKQGIRVSNIEQISQIKE
ncbi:hypothetical protein HHI36_018152 [Cryptolaemus montrouzieri]|uniref:Uncharacterized protein n=1 Tax=Cryptolaemus montrouzieri TaxID=559131 RepID=A0ABD2NZB4_9CUCU